jgi:predicted dehydrogenase
MPIWLGADPDADSQKLKIALIGAGGRGKAHVKGLESQHFVAFCDVDEERAAETYKAYPKVPRFKDYRVMFDRMGKEIEAVSIATPDHMHYPIVLWALAHGKHVFCEKPLTRTFEEAMILKKAVREAGVITQMGNQGHVADGWRSIREWVDAGIAGDIYEAYHWTNRPVWPQGLSSWPKKQPVPSKFDWNLWLGVAPKRDYSPEIAPFNWRGFWDYGSGAIGDIGCHSMDASYSGLQLGLPTSISADVSGHRAGEGDRWSWRISVACPRDDPAKCSWTSIERSGGIVRVSPALPRCFKRRSPRPPPTTVAGARLTWIMPFWPTGAQSLTAADDTEYTGAAWPGKIS